MTQFFQHRIRPLIAAALCASLSLAPVFGADETNVRVDKPRSSIFVRPYQATSVPPINLGNSNRFSQLIRGNNLYLTLQDAIALALENNIDLEIQRYSPLLSFWAVQRAEAGGALRGVNTVSNTNFGFTAGQGVQGTASVVGNNGGNFGGTGSANAGSATISQIGPVTQNLDPVYLGLIGFAHRTSPQYSTFLSGVSDLIDNTKLFNNSISQGLITGGQATLSFNDQYLNENALTNNLNPTSSPTLGISLSHNLLNGFGTAVNSRTIIVAKENLNVSDLTFESQVIAVVSNVLTLYWGLVSDLEDVRSKQGSLNLAQQLFEDNKKQVQIGTLAPIDITQAESQVATSQRDLVFSQSAALQQEVRLKDVLSRRGAGDPVIADVRIVPLDHIEVPQTVDLPPLTVLVKQALGSRVDLSAEELDLRNTRVSALGTANGILPTLRVVGTVSDQGLSGSPNPIATEVPPPDAYYIGGFGNALAQIFRRNFPTQRLSVVYNENIRNDSAQADFGIDQLQLRQIELRNQKDKNQVAVDISNQMIALQQAHTRYQATVQSRILEEQLVTAEQKKYKLGSSTTYAVVQVQRDLATAKSNEIAATAQYANARIALGRVLGTTLQESQISLAEARKGRVVRSSSIPSNVPQQ